MRAAHLGTLVPQKAQPAEAMQDGRERGLEVALLIGVVDAQEVAAAVPARKQPVEQRRAHAPDVEEAGRAGREARARWGHRTLSPGAGASAPWPRSTMATRWGRVPPPAARTMPSDRPNFIWRGFKLATTITRCPTSTWGSG